MRFTVGWLKDYLNFDCSLEHLCEKLTSIGLEVEKVRRPINDPLKFIISIVKKVEKHPNADKLKICTVFDGKNEYQIICGAENVKEDLVNIFVPTTPNPTSGFLLMVPKKDLIYLDVSFEQASKFIVSAGTTNID